MMQLFKPLRQSARVSAGLLVLRLVVGLAFVIHGYGKIQNPFGWMGPNAGIPGVFQALAAVSEFGGGMAWILGLLTPLASFGLACTMTVATWPGNPPEKSLHHKMHGKVVGRQQPVCPATTADESRSGAGVNPAVFVREGKEM